jgi:hypothetical protein
MSKLPDLEVAVQKVPGVSAAMVRWPEPGGPASLRVEFSPEADLTAVARDVLDTLRDVADVDLTTLQVQSAAARWALRRITVERQHARATIHVALQHNAGRQLTGRADGPATARGLQRAAASAALAALEGTWPDGVQTELEWVTALAIEGSPARRAIACGVSLVHNGHEEFLIGVAKVDGDEKDSAIRATLNALNRRLELLGGAP